MSTMKQPESEINEVSRNKWDKDLATIQSLDKEISAMGGILVVGGGMATDAYLGGHQKRPHGDVDSTAYFLGKPKPGGLSRQLTVLLEEETTAWNLYKDDDDKIEFREDREDIPFFERRRVELHTRETRDHAYQTGQYQLRKLYFSDGREIEVKVMELSELVAMKIRNVYMNVNAIGEQGRPTSETDYTDLKQLMELGELDRDRTTRTLSKFFKKISDPDEALAEAEKEYKFVEDLLTTK